MNDLAMIKRALLDDTEKLEALLESMNCHSIRYEQRGNLLVCGLPESNNKRSVQVKLSDSLPCAIRNRGDFSGDLFSLVSYIYHRKRREDIQRDLPSAKKYICETCGLEQYLKSSYKKIKTDIDWLLNIKRQRKQERKIEPNPLLPESTLKQFYYRGKPLPFAGWIEEGISYETQDLYGVGFCLETKRITFPIRNQFGQLVGVKGRIISSELDDRKYLHLYKCNQSQELFNFYIAQHYIKTDKRAYIFESEKSPMKAFSSGIFNTLAIGSSDISPEQAKMIKQLGLDVEIVLCFDKDKTIDEIRKQAMMFEGRKVFGMFDVDNLLEDKMAPVDKGIDIWSKLVANNIYPITFNKVDKKQK